MRKRAVAIFSLLALASTAIRQLDGSLLASQSLHGQWLLKDFIFKWPATNDLGVLWRGAVLNPFGLLPEVVVTSLSWKYGKTALFSLFLGSLALSVFILPRLIQKLTDNKPLSLLYASVAVVGICSDLRDVSTAISVVFHLLTSFILFSAIPGKAVFALITTGLHFSIDSTALFTWVFFLLCSAPSGYYRLLFLALLSPILLGVTPEVSHSIYSYTTALIALFTSLIGSSVKESAKNNEIVSLCIFNFVAAGAQLLLCRCPLFAIYGPLSAGYLWRFAKGERKEKIEYFFELCRIRTERFLTTKNYLSYLFLMGAVIFFNISGFRYSFIDNTHLPKEALDHLMTFPLTSPPLHPLSAGGYVGLRLRSALAGTGAVNFLDHSFVDVTKLKTVWEYDSIFTLSGNWNEALSKYKPRFILCRGRDRLTLELTGDPRWQLIYKSSLDSRTQSYLNSLPPERATALQRRFQEESWYLFLRQ